MWHYYKIKISVLIKRRFPAHVCYDAVTEIWLSLRFSRAHLSWMVVHCIPVLICFLMAKTWLSSANQLSAGVLCSLLHHTTSSILVWGCFLLFCVTLLKCLDPADRCLTHCLLFKVFLQQRCKLLHSYRCSKFWFFNMNKILNLDAHWNNYNL